MVAGLDQAGGDGAADKSGAPVTNTFMEVSPD